MKRSGKRAGATDATLRILVVTPFGTSAVTGGAEKWLFGMITNMPKFAWHVMSLQEGAFCEELRAAGIDVSVRPTGALAVEIARAAAHLSGVLVRRRPDIVVGNGIKAQLVIAIAVALRGIPTVWVKHDYSFDTTLAKPLGWAAGSVVSTAAEVGASVRRDDLVVIHPPVQGGNVCDRARARHRLREHGIEFDSRPTLVMAGRIVPYKGVDDAVAALAEPSSGRWRLVVIGEEDHSAPGECDRLVQLAQERGVADRVTFTSPVQGLGDLFAAFDALAVLTKPTDSRAPAREGFGMTAFEAMQAGVPVVAVEGSPVAERLAGIAGITVPAWAPTEVAAALGRLSDEALRAEMGQSGRGIVAGYANAAEAADSFRRVLIDAAAQGRWSRARQRAVRAVRAVRALTRRQQDGR